MTSTSAIASATRAANFSSVIEEAVTKSTVLIAVIGPRWHRIRRIRRWLGGRDWVLVELEHAGKLRKPVLPVLVGGAPTAALNDLPTTISYLSSINAFSLTDDSWDHDVSRLLDRIPSVAATYAVTAVEPKSVWRRVLWVV